MRTCWTWRDRWTVFNQTSKFGVPSETNAWIVARSSWIGRGRWWGQRPMLIAIVIAELLNLNANKHIQQMKTCIKNGVCIWAVERKHTKRRGWGCLIKKMMPMIHLLQARQSTRDGSPTIDDTQWRWCRRIPLKSRRWASRVLSARVATQRLGRHHPNMASIQQTIVGNVDPGSVVLPSTSLVIVTRNLLSSYKTFPQPRCLRGRMLVGFSLPTRCDKGNWVASFRVRCSCTSEEWLLDTRIPCLIHIYKIDRIQYHWEIVMITSTLRSSSKCSIRFNRLAIAT